MGGSSVSFDMSILASINVTVPTPDLNIANPTWDTFIILAFIGVSLIYAFFVSRERLAIVLLSVYSALAVVLTTPMIVNALSLLGTDDFFKYRLAAFIGTFLLLFILYSHNLSLKADVGHAWWQAIVLSILQVGLLMSSILYFIPHQYYTSQIADVFFTSDAPRSAWMIAPIAAMILMHPRKITAT